MKTMNLPKLDSRASFLPDTANRDDRTIEVVWSTGARVKRYSWSDGPFYEELSMDPKAIRLERFERGAPVLDSHDRHGLSSVLGVVTSARIEDGKGIAKIRFSKREEVEPIFEDVMDGVLRNISIGYNIHKMEKVEEVDGVPVYRAIDFEPAELSFVSVPADAGAQVRSDKDSNLCQIIEGDNNDMKEQTREEKTPEKTVIETVERTEPKIDVDALQAEAIKKERNRCAEIRSTCAKAQMPEDFVTRMIDEGKSLNDVRALIIDKMADKDEKTQTASENISVGEDNTRVSARSGLTEALTARAFGGEIGENARRFANLSFADMARAAVEAAGTDTRTMHTREVVGLAVRAGSMSSSDFPLILQNVLNKSLQKGYMEAASTWQPLATQTTVTDFKQVTKLHLGETGQLEQVLEGGEYKQTKLSERSESYKISKFGRMLAITREAIINDDLNALRLPAKLGKKARDLESDMFWSILTSNAQVMAETGKTLFHADHKNLNEGGAGDITETALAAIRESMRTHKDLDGTSPINIFPRYLVVPAAREVEATKLLTSITPRQSSDVNVFGQLSGFSMQLIVEPRLDDVASKPWFVCADSSQLEMIDVARLAGEEQPSAESEVGFDIDALKYKIRHHFQAHAIDYRGFSRNDG